MWQLQGVPKKWTFCICSISKEPRNGFLNHFFLLKAEIHMYILNTEQFLCDIRGLRYIQNKIWFWNRWVHIHSDLKCSSQHQNDFEIPRLTSDWPDHTMRGPKGLKLVFQGFPGTDRGMSVYLGANLALLRPLLVIPNMNLSIQNPILFCKYLSPLISHINGSVFRIYIWISVFRRKKWSINPFLGSWDIEQIQKVHFFRDALYSHRRSAQIKKIISGSWS